MRRKDKNKSAEISSKQKRDELKAGTLFSLGFTLFFFSVIIFIWILINRNIQIRTDFEHFDILDSMQMKIESNISRLEAQMIHGFNTKIIEEFLVTGNGELKSDIEEYFVEVIEYNTASGLPAFDQMRIIDFNGREQIRVDLNGDSRAVIIGNEQLQNKSDAYYFKESMNLERNSIYMSHLDLNRESGEIEFPPKPVIRVSKAIYNREGKAIGFLILNQNYSFLFDEIMKLNSHDGDEWYLLNKDGYYLYAQEEEKMFAFMDDKSKNIGFFSDFPKAWQEISDLGRERIDTENSVFYSRSFNPNDQTALKTSGPVKWFLILSLSPEHYNEQNRLLKYAILIGIGLITPFLVLTGIILGRSLIRNRWYLKALEKSASYDDMTGLLNHQAAMEQLEYLIHMTQRHRTPLCGAFIDLNDLKRVNDNLGHEKGDMLIKAMSNTIKTLIRNTDVAARIGGDEFLIFFPDLPVENSRQVLMRIGEEYAEQGWLIFGWETSFSWGISEWNHIDDSAGRFITRADKAMYRMKNNQKKKEI